MTNGQTTAAFFKIIDAKTRALILDNIAEHYGITREAALEEVTHDEAEHLLDYVTGPERAATHLFMQRAGCGLKAAA